MSKYLYLLFIVIVGFSVSDVQKETLVLDWTENTGSEENNVLTFFENTDFLSNKDAVTLPVFTRLYNGPGNNKSIRFTIENPVFELIEEPVSNYLLNQISEDIELNTNTLKSGQEQKVELRIVPLKKENGKLYRLKSFQLKEVPQIVKNASIERDWKLQSVLASGKWVKISVPKRGIYKIPFSSLQSWGFNSPSSVNVYGSGGIILSEDPGEVAYDDLEQCAIWTGKSQGADCLFFYAPGINKWTASGDEAFIHKLNDYATKGYFFLSETGSPKTVEILDIVADEPTHKVTEFTAYEVIEQERYNILEHGSGKQWFGDKFINGTTSAYSFTITNPSENANANVRINGAARSYVQSVFSVSTDGTDIGQVAFKAVDTNDSYGTFADESNNRLGLEANEGQLNVQVTYKAANNSAEAWLDYVELNYKRKLIADNNPLFFRDAASVGEGNVVEFEIGNANAETKVLDVSDLNNLKELSGQLNGDVLRIRNSAGEFREYVTFNSADNFPETAFVEEIENQNIHGLSTPEFLIVTHPSFRNSAEELANFHREYDGMSVEVVDVNHVYNEFSSGSKSATGIRNCIKSFYDRGNTLKYVLLFGDGSYDNKGIRPESKSFIPTYQSNNSLNPINSFVTDDYFVMLDAGESMGNGSIDLGVGRIPSATAYEAELVINKIKNYYSPEALGDWRNILCFIGDDDDGGLHMKQSEIIADTINKNYEEFVTEKIYFDAYPQEVTPAGERYPDVNAAINERVKDGVLVLNYIGHANARFLAHESVLTISDINSWSNKYQLPIFVTATCEFSRFDADETSAGEYVLLNPNGGGIGLFSTTRVVYSGANFALSKSFYKYIFAKDSNGEHYRMGDVMRLAKTNLGNGINKRNFSLLADPALKLSYPRYKVETTSLNKELAIDQADTIGTLEKITITGQVSDYFDNVLSDFNGELIPVVYDKEVDMETLGNGNNRPLKFQVQQNVIYKGRASVKDGEFSFSFVVPKDISYKLGTGKIVYYADTGEEDAHGAYTNFYIGGGDSEISDNKGPDIQLYMDSEDFQSGDETSKNPVLLAFLSDENGINTVGTGIGHDITAVLDDDYSNVLVLNNYYQADMDDYTSGMLQYSLKDLAVGKHTLRLKAWDVANNSSEAEIEFMVSGDFNIEAISNYPNPVTTHTYFVVTHNQPDSQMKAIFDIYDVRGQRIDQFETDLVSTGNTSVPIRWDFTDSHVLMTTGIYVYRVMIQNNDGIIATKSGKFTVAR